MPGFLVHQGAIITCSHTPGKADPVTPYPRVKVGQQAVVTQATAYTVSVCALQSSGSTPPCVSAQWLSGAMRVKAGGSPVILQDSQSVCTPTAVSLSVVQCQTRVKGK